MPSVSQKQARTMGAAAHNPAFAKKMGIPVKVAKEFNDADAGHDLSKLPMHKGREGRHDTLMHRHGK